MLKPLAVKGRRFFLVSGYKILRLKQITYLKINDMNTIIVKPQTEKKAIALKQFLKAFDYDFKDNTEEKTIISNASPYNQEFVKKIQESDEDFKAGRRYKLGEIKDLWK